MEQNTTDFKALMEQYERELMQLRERAVPVVAVPAADFPPSSAPPGTTGANFQGNISQEQQAGAYRSSPSDNGNDNSAAEPTITAALQVRVTTAGEALPIPNALVTVHSETDNTTAEQVRLTGISGLTEPLILPATDPTLTLQPAATVPLVTYEISVSAPGYYRVRNSGVPLYGGIATVQPVALIPLPEFETQTDTEQTYPVPRNPL